MSLSGNQSWDAGSQSTGVTASFSQMHATLHTIIWPFSYLETRTRLHFVILMFRAEIETLENHFSWSSEKKWSWLSSRIPGIENSRWPLLWRYEIIPLLPRSSENEVSTALIVVYSCKTIWISRTNRFFITFQQSGVLSEFHTKLGWYLFSWLSR